MQNLPLRNIDVFYNQGGDDINKVATDSNSAVAQDATEGTAIGGLTGLLLTLGAVPTRMRNEEEETRIIMEANGATKIKVVNISE